MNKKYTLKRVKHLSLLIALVLLIFVSSMLIFSHLLKEVNTYFVSVDKYFEEDISDNVLYIKEQLEEDVSKELMKVAQKIENDIVDNTDLDKLEKELSSADDIPDELEKIFRKNIYGVYLLGIENDRNDIFICNKNGILSDYDISSATDKENRTWKYEIKNQYNKKLAKNTSDKLITMEDYNNLVFEREKQSKNKNRKLYKEVTNDTIREIISREGFEGLKPYTFLVPVYITNDGDIFGKYDVVGTHKQTNNKIIIVQEYSLYDYIIATDIVDEINEQARQDHVKLEHRQIMSHLYIFAISMILSVICIIVIISIISNNINDLINKDDD